MKIQKIYDEVKEDFNREAKNTVVMGLAILNKYHSEIDVQSEHNEIYAKFPNMEDEMSEEDIRAMFSLNWRYYEECFVIFT